MKFVLNLLGKDKILIFLSFSLVSFFMSKLYSWSLLSWRKSQNNLYLLQRRVFKSIIVGDVKRALRIQKLIVYSNSARLLSIREVTQVHFSRKIAGIDGKTSVREIFLSILILIKLNF